MSKIWIHSVRLYIKIGLFFYYKQIRVFNAEHLPKNKPVLLLSNHQNALLDALIIGTQSGRIPCFLTRASVFKKPIVSKLLRSLNMLPVYRIRDGWNNLSNNTAVFESCSKKLHEKDMVAIFPEGNHSLKRTVRPLSKGFTRIVFDTLDSYPETDLQLIPVGLNYQNAVSYADSVSMYFGASIAAKDFVLNHRNVGVVRLKIKVQSEISKLTTHIPSDNYDDTLKALNSLNVSFLDPKPINACIAGDYSLNEINKNKKSSLLKKGLKLMLICNLIVPYLVWKFVAQPKIKDPEFIGTFRFAIGVTLVPFWLITLSVIGLVIWGWQAALLYFLFSLCLALITVKA